MKGVMMVDLPPHQPRKGKRRGYQTGRPALARVRRSTYTAEEDFTGADRIVPELGEPGGVVRGRARAPARAEDRDHAGCTVAL